MKPMAATVISYQRIELAGVHYAVVPERELQALARRAGRIVQFATAANPATNEPALSDFALNGEALAHKLLARRQQAGLSQAALAELANIRVETLNRIERGRTTPDFATIRKLVVALRRHESARISKGETDVSDGRKGNPRGKSHRTGGRTGRNDAGERVARKPAAGRSQL
jgi:transcriptional regulator with XRE-family HTH domain